MEQGSPGAEPGRVLKASIGDSRDHARVRRTVRVTFEQFVESMLRNVPETEDKASAGWVCGAEFDPAYRDSENFVARHWLSFDYDHITPDQAYAIRAHFLAKYRCLIYTTASHTPEKPRLRVWLPLSRPAGYDEFQAVSRRIAADLDIEWAARESHVPSQYMFRPTRKPGAGFDQWESRNVPDVDVDEVLARYVDWTDRTSWPHRVDGDGVHSEGKGADPLGKPGLVGVFNRAFPISVAIERFSLPYRNGSSPGRLTFTLGSRPDGAIIYDDDTKLHSHHDTDPARGQVNAYDLVRLHHYGWLDAGCEGLALRDRPSSREMARFAAELPELRAAAVAGCGFSNLDATDTSWLDVGAVGQNAGVSEAPSGDQVPAPIGGPETIVAASSKCTDQENARRIQRKYGHKIISVGGTFYLWVGTHWQEGEAALRRYVTRLSGMIQHEAKALYEKASKETDAEKRKRMEEEAGRRHQWAKEAGNVSKQNACIALLRDLLDFKAGDLNRDRNLLSCLNGVIDLQTGDLLPHDPKYFITACAPTQYDVNATAPRFERFLREIYAGDETVIAFAKRWFGYCVTGRVDEHKMVFHVGGGGNGKSVLMNTLQHVIGPGYYSTQTSALLTLEVKGATPELARLLGQRMVTIAETPDGMELREGLIKALTGGDPITARHLFKDFIEFLPTHKLQVFTNYKPQIRGQDEGIWRRVIQLDYPQTWGSAGDVEAGRAQHLRDTGLAAALAAEAPGILRWLVEGAREWYTRGLDPPEAIRASTERYRSEQDLVGMFVRERATVGPEHRAPLYGTVGSLFPAYQSWCRANGHHPLGRVRFLNEIMRVVRGAAETEWREGSTLLRGVTGLKINDD